ncbi:hypothetical protein DM01DRAFT_1300126 [Hesseltinella vesiculosa]|uniref:BTB domain-containing protein n=1 Tax=Hesseltinella vesiculosa TaxID=101127 RepID=A0A1X2GS95_9FUNG|nr:hypothetical protein DM01DRAFT_1300126 [Hesseltinella vesiculosa]
MLSIFEAIRQNHVDTIQALIQLASAHATPNKDTLAWLRPYLKATNQKQYNLNRRSTLGKTPLHYAIQYNCIDIARLLIDCPLVDINKRDLENGWTPLHKALYLGRIHIVWLLLQRIDLDTSLRDWEGNRPAELFDLTIPGTAPELRTIQHTASKSSPKNRADNELEQVHSQTKPCSHGGSDLYTWGINTNYVLGHLDLERRSRPEKVPLQNMESQQSPNWMHRPPFVIESVHMSKFHSAIVTSESLYNLLICGFGRGGRLGNGKATDAQMLFTPVHWPERIVHVALGRDHTVAVTTSGNIVTFGSNEYGQLGYETSDKEQLVPHKIQSQLMKRLNILGVAASKVHSVVYTATDLYTFGLNQGQLGYNRLGNDALLQTIPKKVPISGQIVQVVATDYATAVLLASHEVILLANFKSQKISFPLQRFPNDINVHTSVHHHVTKLVSGGEHYFGAVTNLGDVFLWSCKPAQHHLRQPNETKLLCKLVATAVTVPRRIWSTSRADRMAVDAAIGQNQVLLSTAAGYVYLGDMSKDASSVKFQLVPRLQRCVRVCASPSGAYGALRSEHNDPLPPMLPQIKSSDLTQSLPHHQITTTLQPQLDLLHSIRQHTLDSLEKRVLTTAGTTAPPDDMSKNSGEQEGYVDEKVLLTRQVEQQHSARTRDLVDSAWTAMRDNHGYHPDDTTLDTCLWVNNRTPLYCHQPMLRTRCETRTLDRLLQQSSAVAGHISVTSHWSEHQLHIRLDGCSLVAVYLLLDYIYGDHLDFFTKPERLPPLLRYSLPPDWQPDFQLLRYDLTELASLFGLQDLDELMRTPFAQPGQPSPSLSTDLEQRLYRLLDTDIASLSDGDADVLLMLDNGDSIKCHELILRQRCPFFACLFDPKTSWLLTRRPTPRLNHNQQRHLVSVDIQHVSLKVIRSVLHYLYTSPADEHALLDQVAFESQDDMMHFILSVLRVADEFLLPGLKRICERALITTLTLRTAGLLLEASRFYFADALKVSCQSFIQTNMSSFVISGLLGHMDESLMDDLETSVGQGQELELPIVTSQRSGLGYACTNQMSFGVLEDDLLMTWSTWIAENQPITSSSWLTYTTLQHKAHRPDMEVTDRLASPLSQSSSSTSSSLSPPTTLSASSSSATKAKASTSDKAKPAPSKGHADERWPLPSSEAPVTPPSTGSTWQQATSIPSKALQMRDIFEMEHTEKETPALLPAKTPVSSSSGTTGKKLSQKERRRLQQEKLHAVQAAGSTKKAVWGKIDTVPAVPIAASLKHPSSSTNDTPSSVPIHPQASSSQEETKGMKIYVSKEEALAKEWTRPAVQDISCRLFDTTTLDASITLLPPYDPASAAAFKRTQSIQDHRRGSTSFQDIQHEQRRLDDWIKGKHKKPLLQIQREESAVEALRQHYIQTLSAGSGEWIDIRLAGAFRKATS